jgi:hypothetical protein
MRASWVCIPAATGRAQTSPSTAAATPLHHRC